jgi:hypothetical protein
MLSQKNTKGKRQRRASARRFALPSSLFASPLSMPGLYFRSYQRAVADSPTNFSLSRRGERLIECDKLKFVGRSRGDDLMAAARFCSECGVRLKVKRSAILPLRAFCPRCSPRFRTVRLVLAVPVVLATIAFAISRFGAQREPFYFIGTPVESSVSGGLSTSSSSVESPLSSEQAVKPTISLVGICGAPTRSGKPCQRKVKGGGYCWQHRDKTVETGSRLRE